MGHLWSTNNPTKTTNTATSRGKPAGQSTNKDNTVTILRQRVSKVRILPGAPSPASTPIQARTRQAGWATYGPHWIWPVSRRELITAVTALFLPLYAAVLWAYQGDRKAAHR